MTHRTQARKWEMIPTYNDHSGSDVAHLWLLQPFPGLQRQEWVHWYWQKQPVSSDHNPQMPPLWSTRNLLMICSKWGREGKLLPLISLEEKTKQRLPQSCSSMMALRTAVHYRILEKFFLLPTGRKWYSKISDFFLFNMIVNIKQRLTVKLILKNNNKLCSVVEFYGQRRVPLLMPLKWITKTAVLLFPVVSGSGSVVCLCVCYKQGGKRKYSFLCISTVLAAF